MFDTSVVRAHAIAGPRRFTLFASLAIHTVVAIGALALTVASTQIPEQPPKQFELFRMAQQPSPPPPPPAGSPSRPPSHQTLPQRPRTTVAQPQLAPQVVPDTTPSVQPQATTDTNVAATTETSGVGEPGGGAPNGVPGGVDIGQPGGTGTATQAGPYTPGFAGVTSARVITRVEPRFPPAFVRAVRNATVIVRCIIDKNGDIQDPEIIHSSFPPFNDAVIGAVRQWKFAPGQMHGQPVDTWFELTVNFQVR